MNGCYNCPISDDLEELAKEKLKINTTVCSNLSAMIAHISFKGECKK